MVTLSPVGLAAAPVANQVSFLATFKEKLCKPFCIDSAVQPVVTINYSTGTARLVGTTVFVPITANISVVTQPGCCNAKTQLFTETFYAVSHVFHVRKCSFGNALLNVSGAFFLPPSKESRKTGGTLYDSKENRKNGRIGVSSRKKTELGE